MSTYLSLCVCYTSEKLLFGLKGLFSTFKTRSNSYNFSKSAKNWLDISILGGAENEKKACSDAGLFLLLVKSVVDSYPQHRPACWVNELLNPLNLNQIIISLSR